MACIVLVISCGLLFFYVSELLRRIHIAEFFIEDSIERSLLIVFESKRDIEIAVLEMTL